MEKSIGFALDPGIDREQATYDLGTGVRRLLCRTWRLVFLLVALLSAVSPTLVQAQAFQTVPALSFSKMYGSGNPLPQVFTVASTTSTAIPYGVTFSTTSGGSWLTVSQNGCCATTPQALIVTVAPDATLAAGTYAGQIIITSSDKTKTMNIPVSLKINAAGAATIDNVTGGLTYSLQTNVGSVPPSQSLTIRNAGSGTLSWTAAATTSDGGAWLTLSAASGTAPSFLNVAIVPSKLPGFAMTAGTATGQVVLKSSGNTITIPVTATVGNAVFRQINPLYFTKAYGAANPLAQVIGVASTGPEFSYGVSSAVATGGSWLTVSPGTGCCATTPQSITVSAAPDSTLAAGAYVAEIILRASNGTEAAVIPVTLFVQPSTATFLDALGGELTFSMVPNGAAPPSQSLPIQNAGAGTLSWAASASTADGAAWISLGSTSGTAPGTLTVSINPAQLPGGGQTAGTFTGQILLQTGTDRVTVPITVSVGDSVFRQQNPLFFTKAYAGGNPMPQVISVASTGANFSYGVAVSNSTGGNWLSLSVGSGCCRSTPEAITVSANPSATLAAGTYFAEVVLKSSNGNTAAVIPVTLTVAPTTATFFDALPGSLTYSMVTGGTAPPAQPVPIRNAGAGTLAWTASTETTDGGKWISLSAVSGSAPSFLNVSIVPANLPGGGLVAGTYIGSVVLQSGLDRVSMPVIVSVGSAVFRQAAPLNFAKRYAGSNPPPQVLTVASTGADFSYGLSTASSTGGNWLTLSQGSGCCASTPHSIIVSVNPASNLAAGTYSAQIVIYSSDTSLSSVVPVTLVIDPTSAPAFDALPGAVTFSSTPTGAAMPSQTMQVRNAGSGTLDWISSVTTADSGKWLTASPSSGTAPANLTVSITPANLPGKGLVAGTYTGQVLLQNGTDRVTIPVIVTLGTSVFTQVAPVTFSKPYAGANPASQTVTIGSTSAAIAYGLTLGNSTGGSWLTMNRGVGCCTTTPTALTLTANPSASLAAGDYAAEIIAITSDGREPMVIPVTLAVNGTSAAATPVFSPPSGTYSTAQSVTITDATTDAALYYTLDGSTPTTSSKLYTGPITVSANQTIKAIAAAPGYANSGTGTAVYTFSQPATAIPISSQTITIADATSGATVYYTTNGSTPTTSSTKYTGPITFTTSATLKFIAVAPSHTQSAVRTVTVTVQ